MTPPVAAHAPATPRLVRSLIGKKVIMAITGVILVLFVIAHLLGNLKVFQGAEHFNAYAEGLRTLGAPFFPRGSLLWVARVVLLVAVGAHIWAAIVVTRASWGARPVGYHALEAVETTYAARTMRWGGGDHRAVRDLSPARLHLRARQSELRPGRRVPQRDRKLPRVAGVGWLRRRHGRRGPARLPRPVERVSDPGPQPAPDRTVASRRGGDGRGADHRRLHRHPGGGARRGPALTVELRSKVPSGPLAEQWERHRAEIKLVNPANKLKHRIIVVGSGLAGASAAASLAELGYNVSCFCFQDSARRAHSIAAQGGINAAKNYQNDGDSVFRLFYDTVKGGDFRAREANVYRLAQISVNIIDQCVAQGVPFAREYGGLLANRSFGGVQVSRTFYARGQTGQQLLLGAYQALSRQIALGKVTMYPRSEMLDLVVVDGRARGIIVRDLVNGRVSAHVGDAVVLATGGYSNVFYLSTNAKGCNVTAIWRAHKRGAAFANPCFTQIHPTCIPVAGHHQANLTLT